MGLGMEMERAGGRYKWVRRLRSGVPLRRIRPWCRRMGGGYRASRGPWVVVEGDVSCVLFPWVLEGAAVRGKSYCCC
jgi:hypothetical protein